MLIGCCRMKRSQTEKPAPGWQLAEPAHMVLLLMLVAADPVVVVDRPCHCDADIKQIYTRPRPHSTRSDATHEHAREREREGLTRLERSTTRHSALVSLEQRSINALLYHRRPIQRNRDFCVSVYFCGCNRPVCVTTRVFCWSLHFSPLLRWQ